MACCCQLIIFTSFSFFSAPTRSNISVVRSARETAVRRTAVVTMYDPHFHYPSPRVETLDTAFEPVTRHCILIHAIRTLYPPAPHPAQRCALTHNEQTYTDSVGCHPERGALLPVWPELLGYRLCDGLHRFIRALSLHAHDVACGHHYPFPVTLPPRLCSAPLLRTPLLGTS